MTGEPSPPPPLTADKLFRPADLSRLPFVTTRDLAATPTLAGHQRAEEAIRLGTSVTARGFNIFACGPTAARISASLRRLLEAPSPSPRKPPSDWVYVNNFSAPHKPTAIALPAGRAPSLQRAMRKMIGDLRTTLPALFESDDYQRRRTAIDEAMRASTQKMFQALGEKATARGVAILRTPMGFTAAPMENGEVVEPEVFNKWPEERRQAVQQAVADIEKEMEQTLRSMPRVEKERRDAVQALDRETARFAIAQEIEEVRAEFADLRQVLEHLEVVRDDLMQHVQLFLATSEGGPPERGDAMRPGTPFERYDVNVVVSNDGSGAPVVEELNPTFGNLLGRVEHMSFQGALVTNFRMIKAGSLHRANGGTIVIDARSLFTEPYAWSALKRALVRQEIVIEDLAHMVGFMSTATLEPSPIPLDVKVVLFGERWIYYLLADLDPEFRQHFKVLADFDDELDRSPENEALLACLVAGLAAEAGLRPLDRGGVEAVVERAARLSSDAAKLSLLAEHLHDVITEADHRAAVAGNEAIARDDVEQAVAAQRRRASRIEERAREMILRDISLVSTEGERVGQVNGLAVAELGGHAFGRPSRITARVGPGAGKIVDIEREVELGGPIHSKGVLILSGFLAGRYARDVPMSLHASLVFEQSYGGIEGDSASVAELCTLLSALGGIPLRQDFAVTGSVNQHGDVQAIGGVNEKIEGFFDVCAARGLTGRQGTIIPASNVQHLMLRRDVVQACSEGRFAVYAVRTIDEAIALLSGRPAGQPGADGRYPEGSVNAAVEACLTRFAAARKAMAADGKSTER